VNNPSGTVSSVPPLQLNTIDTRTFALWAALVTGVAMCASGFAVWMDARSTKLPSAEVALPIGNTTWRGPFDKNVNWHPVFVGAQEYRAEYRKNAQTVEVYLAYYPSQNRDAELINWNNAVFDSKHSRRIGGGLEQAQLSLDKTWPVIATDIKSGDRSRLVWHWYEVDGIATTSRVWAKMYTLRSRLRGSSIGSMAWVISSDYSTNARESAAVMQDFLNEMLPQMREVVSR